MYIYYKHVLYKLCTRTCSITCIVHVHVCNVHVHVHVYLQNTMYMLISVVLVNYN